MKIRTIVLSWDTVLALFITLVTAVFLPATLNASFTISFYSVGISVLSIVFSLFFASLAIIMASSDNDFIRFLEEEGDFTALLDTFGVTLLMLFLSLIYSIVLYLATDYFLKKHPDGYAQFNIFFLAFEFLFSYSLIASALSVKDTMKFSRLRAKYLMHENPESRIQKEEPS